MKKNSKILVLVLVLVSFLTIGYAILSTNIKLNGKSILGKTTFDIYFDNVKILKGEELTGTPPTTTGRSTKELSYEINFSKPRDTYQFNVDIVNGGTLDAMVSLVSSNSLGSEFDQFGEYSLTYADGSTIEGKNYLRSSSKETITVTIRFKDEMSALLAENKQVQFNLTLEYVYADETHDDREATRIAADLSDKAHNGTIHGGVFNNDGTITLDGVDDYVDCGYANYDFNDSITYIAKVKILSNQTIFYLFGNWEGAGGGLFVNKGQLHLQDYIDDNYRSLYTDFRPELNKWYTIVGIYNGSELSMYVNGTKIAPNSESNNVYTGKIKPSPVSIALGTNLTGTSPSGSSNIQVDYALLYDRALTEAEIADYTDTANPSNKDKLLFWYDFD